MTWWGRAAFNKNTTDCIAAYTKANPNITITARPADSLGYWDQVASQVAGGVSPDVIQMDRGHLAGLVERGALLDLSGVDTSKFLSGTTEPGTVDGKQFAITAGISTPVILANPELFAKAGVQLPDDSTWTWDGLIAVAAEVAHKAKLAVGCSWVFSAVSMFQAWLRQHGKDLWQGNGLGFGAHELQGWFELTLKASKAGALGNEAQLQKEEFESISSSALVTGTGAMQLFSSHSMQAVSESAGTQFTILRFPSLAGQAVERKAWYWAESLWSASAATANPAAVTDLLTWWVNSPECANIQLARRGMPASPDLMALIRPKLTGPQQEVATFLTAIQPELGPPLPLPPSRADGVWDGFPRATQNVVTGRETPAKAATEFIGTATTKLGS